MPSIELKKSSNLTVVSTPAITDITWNQTSGILTVTKVPASAVQALAGAEVQFAFTWGKNEDRVNLQQQYPILKQISGKKWKVSAGTGTTLSLKVV
jgi:hypothetical protein